MDGLIINILRLKRLGKRRITPFPQSYDVCRQLADCVLEFESRLDEKNLELETDMADRAFVRADKGLVELVWNNLLSNAVKFTEPGGAIHAESEPGKGSTFTVTLPVTVR